MADGCKFGRAWIGKCGEPVVGDRGMCLKHDGEVCISCKRPATRECDHTGIQFVCGYPICDDCEHGVPPKDNPGWFMLGGGHHPKDFVRRQRIENDSEYAAFLKEKFPAEYEAAMAVSLSPTP